MLKQLQNLSPEAIALLIFISCGTSIHFGGDWLKRYVLGHPETQILQRDPPAPTSHPAGAIHIIREPKTAAPPPQTTADISANQIFDHVSQSNVDNKSTPEGSTDYFELLGATKDKHLQLNAIMHNGAIINGRFIPLNTPIDSVAYPALGTDPNNPSTLMAPLLTAVDHAKQTATIADPIKKQRVITLFLN